MKVLVGIVTRNRARLLTKAILSTLAQDYGNKEVVVFDDASHDETSYLGGKFPDVRWFRAESQRGYVYVRNYLMRTADADLYLSLDDDAWFVQGDEISQGVSLLKRYSNVAAVAYDILSPDQPAPRQRAEPYPTHMYIGCGHLLRLSAVKAVGYYASNPGFYGGEEKDLCVRLLDRCYEVMFLPGVHIWHDKTTMARDLAGQHRSGVCNDLVFAFRRCPDAMLLWLLPTKILSHVRFSLRHGLLVSCLQGIRMFFGAVPDLIHARQPVSTAAFREFRRRARMGENRSERGSS